MTSACQVREHLAQAHASVMKALMRISPALGNRPYPLANRQSRKDVVGKLGSGVDHSPGCARGTDPATLARAGDEEIVSTIAASSADKTMAQHPAFEIPLELAFAMGWAGYALPAIAAAFEPGGEVRLQAATGHGTFAPATPNDGCASGRAGGSHGDSG